MSQVASSVNRSHAFPCFFRKRAALALPHERAGIGWHRDKANFGLVFGLSRLQTSPSRFGTRAPSEAQRFDPFRNGSKGD
jgi:hypothetical protein